MKSLQLLLDIFTRPAVVLGLRVAWDLAFGSYLLLVYTHTFTGWVGFGTVLVGVWTLTGFQRSRRVKP